MPDFYKPLVVDGTTSMCTFGDVSLPVVDVEVNGEEYQKCVDAVMWASSKSGRYGRGCGNTPDDPKHVERTGFLGETAFAKLIGGEVNYTFILHGDPVDFIVQLPDRELSIDVKTSIREPQQFCIYARSEPKNGQTVGTPIQLHADTFVFAYALRDDRHSATIRIVGWQDRNTINALPEEDAPSHDSTHKNKHVRFPIIRPITEYLSMCKQCEKIRPPEPRSTNEVLFSDM